MLLFLFLLVPLILAGYIGVEIFKRFKRDRLTLRSLAPGKVIIWPKLFGNKNFRKTVKILFFLVLIILSPYILVFISVVFDSIIDLGCPLHREVTGTLCFQLERFSSGFSFILLGLSWQICNLITLGHCPEYSF